MRRFDAKEPPKPRGTPPSLRGATPSWPPYLRGHPAQRLISDEEILRLYVEEKLDGGTIGYRAGSWNTHRLVLLWGPKDESHHTFGGAELSRTDGFGPNRGSDRASAIGQYEGRLGERGSYRVTAQGYGTKYFSAGVLRQDDLRAGRVDFFDTYLRA